MHVHMQARIRGSYGSKARIRAVARIRPVYEARTSTSVGKVPVFHAVVTHDMHYVSSQGSILRSTKAHEVVKIHKFGRRNQMVRYRVPALPIGCPRRQRCSQVHASI